MERKKVWIYCRVARPDAFALAAQQTALEAYAEEQGYEIAGITAEQASGVSLSRRGLAEVSNAVAAGEADLLLVTNLSRLGRDTASVGAYLRWLEDHSVEVVCTGGIMPQFSREMPMALMKLMKE